MIKFGIDKQTSLDLNIFPQTKQYIAVTNDKGEKEVWINCFCDTWGKNWRKELIFVKDGGNYYFNLKLTNWFINFTI